MVTVLFLLCRPFYRALEQIRYYFLLALYIHCLLLLFFLKDSSEITFLFVKVVYSCCPELTLRSSITVMSPYNRGVWWASTSSHLVLHTFCTECVKCFKRCLDFWLYFRLSANDWTVCSAVWTISLSLLGLGETVFAHFWELCSDSKNSVVVGPAAPVGSSLCLLSGSSVHP